MEVSNSISALNGLEIGRRSVAMCIYLQKYGCRTLTIRDFAVSDDGIAVEPIWEAVKFWGACPKPPKCFCTLRRSSYKRSVPMLHPSIDGVLATPLVSHAVRILYRLSVRTFNLFTLARTCQLHPLVGKCYKDVVSCCAYGCNNRFGERQGLGYISHYPLASFILQVFTPQNLRMVSGCL